jgi:hypothetical protein
MNVEASGDRGSKHGDASVGSGTRNGAESGGEGSRNCEYSGGGGGGVRNGLESIPRPCGARVNGGKLRLVSPFDSTSFTSE